MIDLKLSHLIVFASSLLTLSVSAKTISPDQAFQRAYKTESVFKQVATRSNNSNYISTKINYIRSLGSSDLGEAAVYVFGDDKRSYFLSSDDQAIALLGYVDTPISDKDTLPPGLQDLINQYIIEISQISKTSNTGSQPNNYISKLEAIAPLCKTEWGQLFPYFTQCPYSESHGRPCVTGCVATAMAQIMKYHEYPQRGSGVISYFWNYGQRELTMDCNVAFDWEHMRDTYPPDITTKQEEDAVALLMKACGYASEMEYMPNESGGADVIGIKNLITHFGYDRDAIVLERRYFPMDEWCELLHKNLKECGPLLYSGYGKGGHAFVCDGYDGEGRFHFNWGWNGSDNGYFSLSALIPSQYDFSSLQTAIFGVKPEDNKNTNSGYFRSTGIYGYIEDGSQDTTHVKVMVLTGFEYILPIGYDKPQDIEFGMKLQKSDDKDKVYYVTATNENNLAETRRVTLRSILPKLDDGNYEVYPVWRNKSSQNETTQNWMMVKTLAGKRQYVELCYKEDDSEMQLPKELLPTFVGMEQISPLVIGKKCLIAFEYRNDTEEELYLSVEECIVDENNKKIAYFWDGDIGGKILMPGESTIVHYSQIGWFPDVEIKGGIYKLMICSGNNNTQLIKEPIEIEIFEIPDAAPELEARNITYKFTDKEIKFELDLDCKKGYYGSKIWAYIYYPTWNGPLFSDDLYMMAGMTKHAEIRADVPNHLGKGEKPYKITLYYSKADTPMNWENGTVELAPEFLINMGDSGEVSGIFDIYFDNQNQFNISSDGVITPKEGVAITVFDILGRTIAYKTANQVSLPGNGVYLIEAGGKVSKIVF